MSLLLAVLGDALFACVAAIGFAIISNPPKKAILISGLLASIGHGCRYYLLSTTTLDLSVSTFIAAFIIGVLGMASAKIIRTPAEVVSFPALLPMIPGMYAYKTILSLIAFMNADDEAILQRSIVEIFRNGLTTVSVMLALTVGVAIPLFIFYEQSFMMTRVKKVPKKSK